MTNCWKNSPPASFLVDCPRRFAGGDDVIQVQPIWDHSLASVFEEGALKAGLGAHEKGLALRRKSIPVAIHFGEKVQADQHVHDASQSALGCAGCRCGFLEGFGAGVEHIEDAVLYRGLQHQRGNKTPGKLHDPFRRNCGGRSAHLCLLLN